MEYGGDDPNGLAIYDDLGSGELYANKSVSAADVGSAIAISLSAQAPRCSSLCSELAQSGGSATAAACERALGRDGTHRSAGLEWVARLGRGFSLRFQRRSAEAASGG